MRSINPRKWACLRSVSPRLRWCPGKPFVALYHGKCKSPGNPPNGSFSLHTVKIPGAPNTSSQFEIAVAQAISDVFSSRFFAPRKPVPKTRKLVLNVQKGGMIPYPTNSISTSASNVLAIGIFATLPNILSCLNSSFLSFSAKILISRNNFCGAVAVKRWCFEVCHGCLRRLENGSRSLF